jgi:hypothetical protein
VGLTTERGLVSTRVILNVTYQLAETWPSLEIYWPPEDEPTLPKIKGFDAAWEAGGVPGSSPEDALLAWHRREVDLVLEATEKADQAILSARELLSAWKKRNLK